MVPKGSGRDGRLAKFSHAGRDCGKRRKCAVLWPLVHVRRATRDQIEGRRAIEPFYRGERTVFANDFDQGAEGKLVF